jgi:murein L,D-transpeptidase YcbB/YkuD
MHDTPTKRLFEATVRAYSHGCMRIRNPLTFAKTLLSHDQGWSMNSVERAVASGNLQTVQLKTPVPVHITYFTAWANEDGEIRYFGDVYGHDSRFAAALKL